MKRQIISCIDLVQEEARYHDGRRAKFTSGKHAKFTAQQKGRPQNNIQQSNNLIMKSHASGWKGNANYIHWLSYKMKESANSDEMDTSKWLKTKSKNKYGEQIFFAKLQGKTYVVCFRDLAEYLINNKWSQSKRENVTEKAERIVKQAVQIILGQTISTKFNIDTYPLHGEISDIELGKE